MFIMSINYLRDTNRKTLTNKNILISRFTQQDHNKTKNKTNWTTEWDIISVTGLTIDLTWEPTSNPSRAVGIKEITINAKSKYSIHFLYVHEKLEPTAVTLYAYRKSLRIRMVYVRSGKSTSNQKFINMSSWTYLTF